MISHPTSRSALGLDEDEAVSLLPLQGAPKPLKRLQIDPLAVYGTLCVKCPVGDPSMADPACIARVLEELLGGG